MTPFQSDPDQDDEDEDQDEVEDDENEDEAFDRDTQDILRALHEEAKANEGSHRSSETPPRSFGDVFWEKNFVAAVTVTKYLSAACIVLVFLFFVTIVLKAFAFR